MRILAWLGTVLSGLAAALMWLNLSAFGNALDSRSCGARTSVRGPWQAAPCCCS